MNNQLNQQPKPRHKQPKLFEGLRANDLKDLVSPIFSLDQYKSKMGEDKDVVVVAFKVQEKMAAMDLMEFIEKGYQYVLDADMSAGEERDGRYSVFIELERNENVPKQIVAMAEGIGKLCDHNEWNFRYFKDENLYSLSEETLTATVPLDDSLYEQKMLSLKQGAVTEFFDHGALDAITIDQENNLRINKPYAESLDLKFVSIGKYADIKEELQGGIQLDEVSQSQTLYLEKYLGSYEIHKINNHFLIRNNDKAMIISKDRW